MTTDPARDYLRGDTIHGLFGWCAVHYGRNIALVHNQRRVSYTELDRLSDDYAATLEGLGVGPGHLVPVLLPRTVEMVAVLLAVLKRGAGYAALDPRWPRPRLESLVHQVNGPVLVTAQDGWAVPTWTPPPGHHSAGRTPTPVPVRGEDPAVVFFTSGSTGTPKGVVLPHHGTARLFDRALTDPGAGTPEPYQPDEPFESFGPDVVQAQTMPMHWDGSILDLWSALLCGGTSVLVDEVLAPAVLRRVIKTDGINGAGFLPGALFNVIVDEDIDAFAGLRFLGIGGERLSPSHVRRFLQRHPDIALTNIYGPVESTALVTAHRIRATDPDDPAGIPLGHEVPHSRVLVLDQDRPVPPGQTGELCLAGHGLAIRYLNNPDLTARQFVEVDVEGERVRVYRTGDLGHRGTDGLLRYTGRNDRQVKVSGHRVEPGEIERTAQRVPGVLRCAVLASLGADGTHQALHLFYVADPAQPVSPGHLRDQLSATLPGYLVPRRIHPLDTLPLTGNGKVDWSTLDSLARSGAGEPAREANLTAAGATPAGPADPAATVAPADPAAVAAAFGQVLDLATAPPATADFFDLGGSSLDAARLCTRLGLTLGVTVPVSQVYRTPTPAGLALFLARASAHPARDTTPDAPATADATANADADATEGSTADPTSRVTDQVVPLIVGQANYIAATTGTTCVLAWWVRDGPDPAALDPAVLRAALSDVHCRHESLRARYRPGTPPVAVVPAEPGEPELCLLTGLPDEPAALDAATAATMQPLDFTAGQVWRAALATPDTGNRAVFAVGIHHIAFDAWSEALFMADLSLAYAARRAGETPRWPAPAPGLAQVWTECGQGLDQVDLAAQRAFWQTHLRTLPRATLPGLAAGPLPPVGPTQGVRFEIPAGDLARWDSHVAVARGSRFSYLLAVFAQVLHTLTGSRDVGVLVPVSTRGTPMLDAAITCRVNPVVLRLRRPANSPADPLAVARAAINATLAAADLPFGDIVAAVATTRPDIHTVLNLPIFLYQDHAPGRLELAGSTVTRVAERQAQDVPSPLALEVVLTATGADLNVGVRTDRVPLELAQRVGAEYLRILRAGPEALA